MRKVHKNKGIKGNGMRKTMKRKQEYVCKEWNELVNELLEEGWGEEEAEAAADEEFGYRTSRNNSIFCGG